MIARESIHYRARWVRLLCCSAIALALARVYPTDAWTRIEQTATELITRLPASDFATLPDVWNIGIVWALCLWIALFRFERPLSMFLCGVAFCLAYGGAAALLLLGGGQLPALVAPLAGIVGSTSLLETMAWNEERRRRQRLERLEKAKQQFADMLVHDVKNHLAGMSLSLQMLDREIAGLGPRAQELQHALRVGVDRTLVQIHSLLDIRKIEEGQMRLQLQPVPLRPLLQRILADYDWVGGTLGVRLGLPEDGEHIVARADPEILSRIVVNLLWNALKHAPPGTEIEFALAPRGSDGCVALSVANAGPAIPPQEQGHLFELFAAGESRREDWPTSGTGLGLAFCRLAAEAHGGRIRLESPRAARGDGVRVTLSLPAAP